MQWLQITREALFRKRFAFQVFLTKQKYVFAIPWSIVNVNMIVIKVKGAAPLCNISPTRFLN